MGEIYGVKIRDFKKKTSAPIGNSTKRNPPLFFWGGALGFEPELEPFPNQSTFSVMCIPPKRNASDVFVSTNTLNAFCAVERTVIA